jgi:hypothetical protein
MRLPILAIALAFMSTSAFAADVATKAAPMAVGYPTKCGFYYVIGIGGSAGAVNTSIAGTQIVQGDLDALVGYTCPFGTYGFWFVEGQGGIANLNGGIILNGLSNNGTTNSGGIPGINLNGPAVFIERFGAGSPINAMLGGLLPAGSNFLTSLNAALPSVPLLPAGVTLSPANIYAFAGIVEADYGATVTGVTGSHQWMVSPIIGLGNLQRASNNVMLDTWAGFQFGSTNSLCVGGQLMCAKLGNMVRVGSSLKF